jgi:hypothetical protein
MKPLRRTLGSSSLPNVNHQIQQEALNSPSMASSSLTLLSDLSARRCISDSFLARSRGNSGGCANSIHNINVMMANRSGGSQVKRMVEAIRCRCGEVEQVQQSRRSMPHDFGECLSSKVTPPSEECYVVAHLSLDSYYRVVVVGCGGIPALVRAMRAFFYDRDTQECCCIALKNLLGSSGCGSVAPPFKSYVEALDRAGGVEAVIAAMKNHPQSVAVQSAACDALLSMSGLLLQHVRKSAQSEAAAELIEVLNHTKQMVLLQYYRTVAEQLLRAVMASL